MRCKREASGCAIAREPKKKAALRYVFDKNETGRRVTLSGLRGSAFLRPWRLENSLKKKSAERRACRTWVLDSKAAPMPPVPLSSLGITRALLVAIRVVPVLVIVCLSAPAWASWIFLSKERQEMAVTMVKALGAWAVAAAAPEPVTQPQPLPPAEEG